MNEEREAEQKSWQGWQETFQQGLQQANEAWMKEFQQTILERHPGIAQAKQSWNDLQKAWNELQDASKTLQEASKALQESLKRDWRTDFSGPLAVLYLQQAQKDYIQKYANWEKAWDAFQAFLASDSGKTEVNE